MKLVEGNTLSISAQRESTRKEQGPDGEFHISERRFGRVSRSIKLPPSADVDAIKASYEDGVLRLVVPRRASGDKEREIELK